LFVTITTGVFKAYPEVQELVEVAPSKPQDYLRLATWLDSAR
jgi:hypothetical protein